MGRSAKFWEDRPPTQVDSTTIEHPTNSGSADTPLTTPAKYTTKFAAHSVIKAKLELNNIFQALPGHLYVVKAKIGHYCLQGPASALRCPPGPAQAGLNQNGYMPTLTYALSLVQISVWFLTEVFLLGLSLCPLHQSQEVLFPSFSKHTDLICQTLSGLRPATY